MQVATVEHLADFNAATEQIVPGGFNVGDGQVQALSRARCCLGDVLAEDYRAPGAGRRELDPTPVVAGGEIGVESPPESCVELFRAIDIRDRDDDHLKLHVDSRGTRVSGWFIGADCTQCCHFVLLMHSHKLKVRSGLWRLPRSSNLYSWFSAVVLFRRGGNCERHCLGLTREDLMVGVHQFNHPVSTMRCPHVKPAEVYSCSGCD